MPLMHGKSEKAFSHNVAAERNSGKPMKQSLAIAYAVKKKAGKYAKGGMVPEQGEMKERIGKIMKGSNESMPVTEGTEHDDFLSPESDDTYDGLFEGSEDFLSDEADGEEEGVLQRIMSRRMKR